MSHWLGDRDVPVTGRWALQDKDTKCCSLPSILVDSGLQQLKLRRHEDSLEDRLKPFEQFIVYQDPELVFPSSTIWYVPKDMHLKVDAFACVSEHWINSG